MVPFDAMKSNLITILDRYGKSQLEINYCNLLFSSSLTIVLWLTLRFYLKCTRLPWLEGQLWPLLTTYLLQPLVWLTTSSLHIYLPLLPSYIKDTTDFIHKISNLEFVPGSYLVTADVTSLYTNIPIAECIIAIDLFCGSVDCEFTVLVTELSRFILTNNYFEVEGILLHKKWGLAMVTPFVVSAAVIYMARLENPLLSAEGLL